MATEVTAGPARRMEFPEPAACVSSCCDVNRRRARVGLVINQCSGGHGVSDESCRMLLSNPTGAPSAGGCAIGTIFNDERIGTNANNSIVGSARMELRDSLGGRDVVTGANGADRFGFRIAGTYLSGSGCTLPGLGVQPVTAVFG